MKYETERFIYYYNEDDKNISSLIKTIEEGSEQIMDFFQLKLLKKKNIVKIYYTIEEYKEHIIPYLTSANREYHEWMIADTFDDNINLLALEVCQQLECHKDRTLNDAKETILHEFTHNCHHELQGENNARGHIWFHEALATNLSGQEFTSKIKCTYEELKNDFDNAQNSYGTSYLMGKYMIDNYGNDFVIDLIKNHSKLNEFAPKLFEEAKKHQNNDKKSK